MYAKVFRSLWDGTLRGDAETQLVFIYLLAHADVDGTVDVVPQKISDDTGLVISVVERGLARLEMADDGSRTPDDDGRRIVRLSATRPWGWQIVNYIRYRKAHTLEDRRRQNREAQRRYRRKARDNDQAGKDLGDRKHDVSMGKRSKRRKRERQKHMKKHPSSYALPSIQPGSKVPTSVTARGLQRAKALFQDLDVDMIEAKMMTYHEAHPYKNLDRALLNWCKKARENGWDRKTENGSQKVDAVALNLTVDKIKQRISEMDHGA